MRRSALGRKALTVLVSTAMVVSMMPTAALADAVSAGETPTEQSQVKENEPGGGDSENVANQTVAPAVPANGEGSERAVAKVGETTYTSLDEAFAALGSSNHALTLLDETAWNAATPVYYKAGETRGYAAKLTEALTAAYKANAGDITIVCRPGSDLGFMTHGHVADNITIYGNGAYVSGGECDLEVDTFQYSRETGKQVTNAVTELAGKTITINAYDVDNLGVWGQRNTGATVNVNLTNCDGKAPGATNLQRVYISGTSGVNNFTLTDCDFITAATAVYSNADGAVAINNCSFTGSIVPVNFNHKASGAQTVTIANSTFTNCGTTGEWAAFAAPARFVNSGAGTLSATINVCSFDKTLGMNGDILIGDGRMGNESNEVALTVTNTAANVQAQQPGYYGASGTTVVDESRKGEVATTTDKGLDGASINSIVTPAPAAVAEVNGKSYSSLQAAIDEAQAGDTVKLIANAVVDATVVVKDKGAITLDLNGKTISNTKEIWNADIHNWSLVSVRGNSDLTIMGEGAIEALENDSYAIDLQDAASKCTIKNGAFIGNICAVYVFDGSLTINGGTFDIKQLSGQGDRRFTINCYDSSYKNGTAKVSISGGTFNGFDPANNLAEGTGTAFTAPGYTTVKNEDGTYDVKEETRGTETHPYTLTELGVMTRKEYADAQEALDGTMYVEVGDYTYDKDGVLGNGVRNDTPGQNPDHSKLNAYGENGYLNEKNDGANGKKIVFVKGSITSRATGYNSIDDIGTSLLLAVPAYTNVTFKGITFNNVMSFNYQLYTSPWSQLGELKFDDCTFNGIIVGAIAAQTLTFNHCTFKNYKNTTTANNSNPTWTRPAYGNWTAGDNKGQGDNFQSLTRINFTNNTVTSTRPVKFENISQWDIRSTVTVTNNSFDISPQVGDKATKNVGLYLGAHKNTNAFDLVADGNSKSVNTAALYTIPAGETSLPLGSTVTNTNGDQIELTDALKWKATDAAQDKIVLKTVKAVASVDTVNFATLTEAINAAQDGQTVTLLADATEDVVISKSITLDLGGKTLTNTNADKATISVQGGTVTVKNGNVAGGTGCYNIEVTKGSNANLTLADVTATAGNTGSSMIDNWGTLTIESGSYSGGLNVVKSEEGSTLSITGGTFTLDYAPSSGYTAVILVYGDTTISGGEFVQTATPKWGNPQVVMTGVVEGYTAITRVTGGHFTNKKSGSNIFHGLGKATSDNFEVSGGTFNKSISEGFCADGFIPTKNADGTYGVKEGHYVAQIDSKKYETLADAIRLAAKGKTITLLTDVEQNTQLTINKNITLDLNGKIIKNTQDIWGDKANAILSITNGAKVTITGDGTIDAKENDCYTINVVKGDLTIENGTFYGNVSVVQVEEGTLSVKGGTFDLHQKWEGSSKYLFNCIDDAYASGSANVAISGGTFVGFDPSASPEGEGTSYLAPGYAPTDNGDGMYGVKLAEGAYLLQDHRSGKPASWTYPTQEGMAFAGWYKDAAFKTACTTSDVEGAAYAKFVKISDLITFKGGSLRTDLTGKDDYSKTSLRFGYEMHAPEGSKIDFKNWGWYYKSPYSADETFHKAENYWRIDNNGVIANFVLSPIYKSGYQLDYNSVFDVTAQLAYITADGTGVKVKDQSRSRSVDQVAKAIQNDSFASADDLAYANGILGSN